MKKAVIPILLIIIISLPGCVNDQNNFDASGSFETEEVIISSQGNGILLSFDIDEGQIIESGQVIGWIDSVQLDLRRKQIQAQINAMLQSKPDIAVQLAHLQQQMMYLQQEQSRIHKLLENDAATSKQLDDINVQISVLEKQIKAQKSTLTISVEGIDRNIIPLEIQVEQLNDQIRKCKIINPIQGVVLTKYAMPNEMTSIGRPLYKIADLKTMILRAYISGDQLSQVKLNQKVNVFTDNLEQFREAEGKVIWISDRAEFTPKTIQTKNERANMVYAIKVKVKNDGSYKIGMYGEITFQ